MIKYEVGKEFPFPHPSSGREISISDLTTAFFDVKCYLSNPTPEEIKDWRKGNMKYGFYVNDFCPFFIMQFDNWNLDVSINVLKIKNEAQREQWLNEQGNIINLFLIDSKTNALAAMRTIGVEHDTAESLKDALEHQISFYNDNAEECDQKIAQIQNTMTPDAMIQRCKMVKL